MLQKIMEAMFLFDQHHVSVTEFVVAGLFPALLTLLISRTRSYALYAVFASLMMVVFAEPIARAIVLFALLNFLKPNKKAMGYALWAVLIGVGCGTKYYLATTCFSFLLASVLILLRERNQKRASKSDAPPKETPPQMGILTNKPVGE